MPEHQIVHPLPWWSFYGECFRYATTGVWGVIGDASTVLAFGPRSIRWVWQALGQPLPGWAVSLGDESLWNVPLLIGGTILLGRLITAPFLIYRDKARPDSEATGATRLTEAEGVRRVLESRIEKLEERRPRIRIDYLRSHTTYSPRTVAGTFFVGTTNAHVVVRNTGEIEAKRVQIQPIRFGAEGTEGPRIVFLPVDVLGATESKPVKAIFFSQDLQEVKAELDNFLVQSYVAETESIQLPNDPDAPSSLSDRDMGRVVSAGFGMADDSIEILATYLDNLDRFYTATYRLAFSIREKKLTEAEITLDSDGEPTPVSRGDAPVVVS